MGVLPGALSGPVCIPVKGGMRPGMGSYPWYLDMQETRKDWVWVIFNWIYECLSNHSRFGGVLENGVGSELKDR